jgi:ribosomal protein S18 acetylase RimI-like enzyme
MGKAKRARKEAPAVAVQPFTLLYLSGNYILRRNFDDGPGIVYEEISVLMTELMGEPTYVDALTVSTTLQQPCSKTVIACNHAGTIIGMATISFLHTMHGKEGRVDNFVVLSEYRKQGYAQQMMTVLLREAADNRVDLVELICGRERLEARSFYRKNGFEESLGAVFRKYI